MNAATLPAGVRRTWSIDWDRLNLELDEAEPEEILRTTLAAFAPNKLSVISAFGPASLVVLHHLARRGDKRVGIL